MTLTITPAAQDAIETGRTGPDWEPTSKTAFYAQLGKDFAFGPTPEAATEALMAQIAPTPAVEFDLAKWLDGFWPSRRFAPISALTDRLWTLTFIDDEERGEDAVQTTIFRTRLEAIRAFTQGQFEFLDGFSDDAAEMMGEAAAILEQVQALAADGYTEGRYGPHHYRIEQVRV